MQGRTSSNINFVFTDFQRAKEYLKTNPYPVDYVIKKHKKECLNNEYYAEMKNFHEWKDSGTGNPKRIILYRALRDYIVKKHKVVVVKEYPTTFFVWNGFYYSAVDKSFLLSLFENIVVSPDDPRGLTGKEIGEFLGQFDLLERDKIDTLLLKNRGWLPFKNGVLNTRTMEFTNHNPNLFFRFCIPYSYELSYSDDPTPNWNKLLHLLLEGNIQLIEIVEFYLGYVLSQEVSKNFQYFLVFIGSGNNGKSFFLDVIRNMFTADLITTAEIEKMSDPNNRFSMAAIENKILILNDDVSDNVFKNPDFLKRLVGGNETLLIERKNVDPYEIRILAKPILTTNQVPYLPDITQGFQRRFLSVPLYVDIDTVPRDQLVLDPDGDKRMFTKEYPHIINKCLNIYHTKKDNFDKVETGCEVITETRKKIVGMSSSLTNFFDDKLYFVDDKNVVIFCKDLYELYKVHYDNNPKYQKKFNNFLNDLEKWASKIVREKSFSMKDILGLKRNHTSKISYKIDYRNDELFVAYKHTAIGSTMTNIERRTTGAFLTGFVYLSDWLLMKEKEDTGEIEF